MEENYVLNFHEVGRLIPTLNCFSKMKFKEKEKNKNKNTCEFDGDHKGLQNCL